MLQGRNYAHAQARIFGGVLEDCEVLEGHTAWVNALTVSWDGSSVYSAGEDKTVRIWRCDVLDDLMSDGKPTCNKFVLEGHTKPVLVLALSKDGHTLFSAGDDATVRCWRTSDGTCLQVLTGHKSAVRVLAVSADGTQLLSGSADMTIRVFDTTSWECKKKLLGHEDAISAAVWSVDGRFAFSASRDGALHAWDIAGGSAAPEIEPHSASVEAMVLNKDGSILATGSEDRTIKLICPKSFRTLRTLTGHDTGVLSLLWSNDGSVLFSGSEDCNVRVWHAGTGKCLRVLEGHSGCVRGLALSWDGSTLFSASFDSTIRVWDTATGEALALLKGHTWHVRALALTPDGGALYSAGAEDELRLWRLADAGAVGVQQHGSASNRRNCSGQFSQAMGALLPEGAVPPSIIPDAMHLHRDLQNLNARVEAMASEAMAGGPAEALASINDTMDQISTTAQAMSDYMSSTFSEVAKAESSADVLDWAIKNLGLEEAAALQAQGVSNVKAEGKADGSPKSDLRSWAAGTFSEAEPQHASAAPTRPGRTPSSDPLGYGHNSVPSVEDFAAAASAAAAVLTASARPLFPSAGF